MKKLKILQVIQTMGKGGAERYAADLSIALKNNGHVVKLVSLEPKNDYKYLTDKIDYEYCPAFVQPSISGTSTIETKAFDDLVRNFKPDVIHTHLFKTEMATRQNIYKDAAYITSCQNNMPEFANWHIRKSLKKITYTRLYEKNWMLRKYRQAKNVFIAISRNTYDYYITSLPKDLRERVHLIHHAINYPAFFTANHDRSHTLDKIKLIYVARFVPIKNHIFLVDVVKYIKDKSIPVSLQLLGEGAEMEKVKQRAIELDVSDLIEFTGNVEDVPAYLRNANFYVHPATYEPFGLVIIEAMAAGLPVICLDGKGNRDLIKQGKNGYMIFENNHVSFAERILEIFRNPAQYVEISRYATSFAESFDFSQHVERIENLYYQSLRN